VLWSGGPDAGQRSDENTENSVKRGARDKAVAIRLIAAIHGASTKQQLIVSEFGTFLALKQRQQILDGQRCPLRSADVERHMALVVVRWPYSATERVQVAHLLDMACGEHQRTEQPGSSGATAAGLRRSRSPASFHVCNFAQTPPQDPAYAPGPGAARD
jgi:hypothetical protein